MPTRTINLKMIIDRGEKGEKIRRALWTTHAEVNRAVAEVEEVLLWCRGAAFVLRDRDQNGKECERTVPEFEVRAAALRMARAAQKQNGKTGGTDEEVLQALRSFYETLVPSACLDDKGNPLRGEAQASNAWVSPLMDQESKPGEGKLAKIVDPLPAWCAGYNAQEPSAYARAEEWLRSGEGKGVINAYQSSTGRKSGWLARWDKQDHSWAEHFIRDQEKQREEAGPFLMVQQLQRIGIFPLLSPPIRSRLAGVSKGVSPWDRLAVRLAVAHLLSWESWNHRCRKEYDRLREKHGEATGALEKFGDMVQSFREYEKERHRELMRIAEATEDRPYRIGSRAVRGWDRVRAQWLKEKGATEQCRIEILQGLQTKLRGKFGDPILFRWLAKEENTWLWQKVDPLPVLVHVNLLEGLLARAKSEAAYTPPDPVVHPRWASYEKPGGSNLKNYKLKVGEKGEELTVPLLAPRNGALIEEEFPIPLAPSGQFASPGMEAEVKERKKELALSFYSNHQQFRGLPGGSDILFDRRYLENCERDRRAQEKKHGGQAKGEADQQLGSVWFKMTLDIMPQVPAEWLDGRGRATLPAEVKHFKTALVNQSKHTDALRPGLRVLSLDMGLRTFASCSIFEFVQGKPKEGVFWLADERLDLWARKERSFPLSLPGERVGRKAKEARWSAMQEIRTLRTGIDCLRLLRRLTVVETAAGRESACDALLEKLQEGKQPLIALEDVSKLRHDSGLAHPAWQEQVMALYRSVERVLGKRISDWRHTTQGKPKNWQEYRERRGYEGGKSLWAIEYLDAVRKTLQRWSLRGRAAGQINRMDRERQGTFAAGLLDHINCLKEDRTKTGADLIIQAARGYVSGKNGGWEKKHEPCRVILMEDLARYRFRSDRPKRENSQLMKWSHREILREVEMQAQLYGLCVETTAAGFSSRFHAETGAPGCRCRYLDEDDFVGGRPKEYVELALENLLHNGEQVQPRQLVPWEGGELFATLDQHGKLVCLNADRNAAENLQRRFWLRCGDAFRVSAVKMQVDGKEYWYPDRDGVRLRGALSTVVEADGYCRLVEGDGPGLRAEKITKKEWSKALGRHAQQGDEEGEDEVDEALASLELDIDRTDERETFFRDPSGLLMPKAFWYPAPVFWGRVRQQVFAAINGGQSPQGMMEDDVPL